MEFKTKKYAFIFVQHFQNIAKNFYSTVGATVLFVSNFSENDILISKQISGTVQCTYYKNFVKFRYWAGNLLIFFLSETLVFLQKKSE